MENQHATLRRSEKNARLMEYKCVELVEELLYGYLRKEQLVKHWEGDLGERGGLIAFDMTRRPSPKAK